MAGAKIKRANKNKTPKFYTGKNIVSWNSFYLLRVSQGPNCTKGISIGIGS